MNAIEDSYPTLADFTQCAEEGRNEFMTKLQAKGQVVAAVGDPSWEGIIGPVTHKHVWWSGHEDVKTPTNFIYHWALPEGQLRTSTRYRRVRFPGEKREYLFPDLFLDVVSKEGKKWVTHASGELKDCQNEMAAGIASFPKGTDQGLVDRVASLLWEVVRASLSDDPAARIALMAIGTRCIVCQRALRDEISKIIGFGPTCAKGAGIPHTLEFARHVESLKII